MFYLPNFDIFLFARERFYTSFKCYVCIRSYRRKLSGRMCCLCNFKGTEFQQQNQLQVQQSSIHSSQPKSTTIFISDSLRHKKLSGAI